MESVVALEAALDTVDICQLLETNCAVFFEGKTLFVLSSHTSKLRRVGPEGQPTLQRLANRLVLFGSEEVLLG